MWQSTRDKAQVPASETRTSSWLNMHGMQLQCILHRCRVTALSRSAHKILLHTQSFLPPAKQMIYHRLTIPSHCLSAMKARKPDCYCPGYLKCLREVIQKAHENIVVPRNAFLTLHGESWQGCTDHRWSSTASLTPWDSSQSRTLSWSTSSLCASLRSMSNT